MSTSNTRWFQRIIALFPVLHLPSSGNKSPATNWHTANTNFTASTAKLGGKKGKKNNSSPEDAIELTPIRMFTNWKGESGDEPKFTTISEVGEEMHLSQESHVLEEILSKYLFDVIVSIIKDPRSVIYPDYSKLPVQGLTEAVILAEYTSSFQSGEMVHLETYDMPGYTIKGHICATLPTYCGVQPQHKCHSAEKIRLAIGVPDEFKSKVIEVIDRPGGCSTNIKDYDSDYEDNVLQKAKETAPPTAQKSRNTWDKDSTTEDIFVNFIANLYILNNSLKELAKANFPGNELIEVEAEVSKYLEYADRFMITIALMHHGNGLHLKAVDNEVVITLASMVYMTYGTVELLAIPSVEDNHNELFKTLLLNLKAIMLRSAALQCGLAGRTNTETGKFTVSIEGL